MNDLNYKLSQVQQSSEWNCASTLKAVTMKLVMRWTARWSSVNNGISALFSQFWTAYVHISVSAANQTRVVVNLLPTNDAWSRSRWLKAVRWLSISGIAGSNPAAGMRVRLLYLLWRQRPLQRACDSFRGELPVVCVCVCVCGVCVCVCVVCVVCVCVCVYVYVRYEPEQTGSLRPRWAAAIQEIKQEILTINPWT